MTKDIHVVAVSAIQKGGAKREDNFHFLEKPENILLRVVMAVHNYDMTLFAHHSLQ